ncbi:hypothetical protein DBR40_07215 [Pedobacter sp. KBW01]|uniref:phosphoribosyltransferase-like protein n=1 Tax=Pedobacter sp. KBW01 TaxID=2153364 RepID=UPI000F5A8893|nr:hypothetical protein [Pedobacter sp. KBW01]RQO77757.1 hypothetical protein DBR40_07215 [Pedobacter sp. KBW01]
MDALIDDILTIIGNYRIEEAGFFFRPIDRDRVTRWINQFEADDREFILGEFLHLLPKSYLSRENTLRIFGGEMEIYCRDFGYENVTDLLDECRFLDCQQPLKSQKDMLAIMNATLLEKYGYTLNDCGQGDVKYWIYLDDVLASGGNFRGDIEAEIAAYGPEAFRDSGIKIIGSFIILHNWGGRNVRFGLTQKLGFDMEKRIRYYCVSETMNYPVINYYNPDPLLDVVYPKQSQAGENFLQFIEGAFDRDYPLKNFKYAFRPEGHPKTETYYSSPEARDRYENILLTKGIEIINRVETLTAPSVRPLGFTPPSFQTLGTGTHFFTWRNISNTCPLVFWWGSNGWFPLFEVKNRGAHW